jgi:predicted TIM-barrel enzyme
LGRRATSALSHAVIVTGSTTGEEPSGAAISNVRRHCRLPLLLGSGITDRNLRDFYQHADGFIVGSSFKNDGHWHQTVDAQRVSQLMSGHAAAQHASM